MVMNSIFPQSREVLANYNWIDLVSATGYVMFDGINARDSGGSNYMLIDSSAAAGVFGNDNLNIGAGPDTTPFITVVDGLGAGPTKCLDANFDLSPFQLPRTLEGSAFVGLSLGSDSATANGSVQIKAKLRKWNGASETEIVATNSEIKNLLTNTSHSYALKLTVPKTHFKKGEQLRLTIELWSTDINQIALFHIPDNTAYTEAAETADGKAGNTRLTLAVPFKLDFM